jgi:hypothetical protein
MNTFIEKVELPSGDIVAVGPFATQEAGQAFAENIEYGRHLATSHGGLRYLSVRELAAELGVKPSVLKP